MGEHKARMRAWMKNHRLRVRATALGLLLSAAFMGAATLAIARDSAADRYERYLESVYSASFYDLRDHLDGVEVKLGKLMVVQSPQAQAQLLEDIYRHSEAVQQCVALLPECLGAFSGTMAFVNRLGDYSHQLSLQALQGVQLTETDRTQLQELRTQCGAFCREARALGQSFDSGDYRWCALLSQAADDQANIPETLQGFGRIESASVDYPTLIYDGPFSESRMNRAPKRIENLPAVTAEQATARAQAFVPEARVEYAGAMGGSIPAHIVNFSQDNRAGTVLISQQGGEILSMTCGAAPSARTLDMQACTQRALAFLGRQGYLNMTPTYAQAYGNVAVINTACQQGGVTLYTDLIKVKVDMQTGDIVGFEAWNYVMDHVERTLAQPALSRQQACARISPNLAQETARLCLIPESSGREVLCWEISGTYAQETYLVYINAESGAEQKVLLILDADEGNLVI